MTSEPRRSSCLDAETLAAFAEGRIANPRRAEIVEHLDTCEECMTEVALAIRQLGREPRIQRSRSHRRIAIAAAALLVLLSALVLWIATQRMRRPSLDRLVAIASRSSRTVEPRLSGGFAWAVYHGGARAGSPPTDPAKMKLAGAAGELIERASHDDSAEAQHAAGVAMVLVEAPLDAIPRLEAAARKSNDAKAWNDLAAARYAAAADLQRASLYPLALAAADRALRLDPAMAEASFNRALILERMRLHGEARRAWTRYLEIDPSSAWAKEARAHLEELPTATSSSRFERDRPRLEDAAARADLATVRALVTANPERARAHAETEILGQWGEAVASDDAINAKRLLTIARTIGATLAATSGESLLHDTVAFIDRASPADRRAVAAAHARYRRARIAYSRHQIADAQRDLTQAATELARAGDPMAIVAEYYAASARLAANDLRGARAELERLRREADQHPRFIAIGARIRWELARAHRLDDDPLGAAALLAEGAAMFGRIGERTSEAMMQSMLANALSSAGRGDDGWSARIRAFEALSREGDPDPLITSLGAARQSELLAGRHDAALAMARLETPIGRTGARAVDVVDALVQRALLETAAGDDDEALRSAREAEQVAGTIGDPALRAREEAAAAFAIGAAQSRAEPRAAIASLTRAIEFHRAHELPIALAEPLLLRARALRATGDLAAAARDLEDGMRLVERHRNSDAPIGGGVLDAENALFEEAIALALDRNDSATAFATAECSRGGTLTIAQLQRKLAGTAVAVVAIVALPNEVVTFAVNRRDAMVSRRTRSRDAIATLASASLTSSDTRAAEALYDELLRAVEPLLASAQELIVIPDRTLQATPFGALHDRVTRRYLIERFPVAIAANATSLTRRPTPRLESLAGAALASGQSTNTRGLPSAAEELDDIRALYAGADAIGGTPTFAMLGATEADVLHIAGHTERQPGGGEQALLFGSGDRVERVSWRTIARAPRVRAEVVVLSACETLRPPASSLTHAPSLGAAFAAAGALDVIGTLMAIPDRDAHLLFRAVHRELASGASAAEAVRAAQIAVIRGDGAQAWRTIALFTRRIPAPAHEQETIAWAH